MVRKVVAPLFDQRMREHVIDVYQRHNAQVRATIPAGRLLVYEVARGREPLCSFLGVPVPDAPIPKVTTTQEFIDRRRTPTCGGRPGRRSAFRSWRRSRSVYLRVNHLG